MADMMQALHGPSWHLRWHSDEKSGRGIETWSDGARYEGEFLHGSKHGALLCGRACLRERMRPHSLHTDGSKGRKASSDDVYNVQRRPDCLKVKRGHRLTSVQSVRCGGLSFGEYPFWA